MLSVFTQLDAFIEDLYSENNVADLERYDWDTDLAACFVLGKNCKAIAFDQTAARILELRNNPDNLNIARLAEEFRSGITTENLKYLEAFLDGMDF